MYVCAFFYMYVCFSFGECAEVTWIFGGSFCVHYIEKTSKSIILSHCKSLTCLLACLDSSTMTQPSNSSVIFTPSWSAASSRASGCPCRTAHMSWMECTSSGRPSETVRTFFSRDIEL